MTTPDVPVRARVFLATVFVAGAVAMLAIYHARPGTPPIRSDGLGYYVYLPAALIDHDLTLHRTIDRNFHGRVPEQEGVNPIPGQRLMIKYPLGEALLLSPFFVVADLTASLTRAAPATGFSTPYQIADAAAGLVYLVIGLGVLYRLLARTFRPATVLLTLVLMTFGTDLFHYGTYDDTFSHVYSFVLFACFLTAVEWWYREPSRRSMAALAVAAGLITITRLTNSIVFVFAIAYGIVSWETCRERGRVLLRQWRLVGIGAIVYAAVLFPQIAYWRFASGQWLMYPYTGEGFAFSHPHVLDVLFSVRKGVFFWSPILLLSTVGFFLMRRYKPAYIVPTAIFMPINLYVVASWHDWAYGGSFGHRAFVESIPIFAFGYASLFEALPGRRARFVLASSSIVLSVMSLHLMVQYWLGAIPFDGTTWPVFIQALTSGY